MAKYNFDYSEPKGDWTKDEIAFYQAIHNVKLMANYINKDSKLKREWFATYNIGQDNANLVVESNYVGIRLFFEFTDTGFVYVSTRDISGATYNNRIIGGWNYSKTDDWNGYFEMIVDILENFFDRYFESKKSNRKSLKESMAINHESNIEHYADVLMKKHKDLSVTYDFDDEDCYFDISQENQTTGDISVWSFCIDFGVGKVYMLEPRNKKLDDFNSDSEILRIILDNI